MADRWIPTDLMAYSPALSNMTENPTTVQFNHRVLGTSTLALITGLCMMVKRRQLPPRAYKATVAFGVMAWVQACWINLFANTKQRLYLLFFVFWFSRITLKRIL